MKSLLTTAIFASVTALGVVGVTYSAPSAIAQSSSAKSIVDDAKNKGLIGETPAGYLALVESDAPQSVVDAMNEINIGRKSVYTRRAREQKVSVDVLAALTGEKLVKAARPGQKVMSTSRRWVTVR